MLIITIAISTAFPILYIFLVRKLDMYRTGAFSLMILSFAWGIVSYFLATFVNPAVRDLLNLTTDQMVRFIAPVAEEILKCLLIIYLIRRADFKYFVDGLLYGFTIGIGFAVVENYAYALGNPSLAIVRVLSTNLMHAAVTSITGTALGWARFQKPLQGLLYFIPGLLLSIAIHMGYNNMVTLVESNLFLLIYAFGTGLLAGILVTITIRRGVKQAQIWISEKLTDMGGVTQAEAKIVDNMTRLSDVLKPVSEKFPEKIPDIEQFLRLQAHLGILQKSLEKLQDENMARSTRAQIEKTHKEMDDIRRKVGTYAMLYVRGIYKPDTLPFWMLLDDAITKATRDRESAPRGKSLFDSLDSKLSQRSENGG